jgi:HEAT repeat protein
MANVFISYSIEDNDFADKIRQRIENAGFSAWKSTDQLKPGQQWRDGIDSGINDAFALIVIMSPAAKKSEYVTYEWAFAWGAQIPVIPILHKETKLHPRLEVLQYLKFMSLLDNQRPWSELIERLQTLKAEYDEKQLSSLKLPNSTDFTDTPLDYSGVVAVLRNGAIGQRLEAVRILGQSNDPSNAPFLREALRDRNPIIHVEAIRFLGQLKDTSAVPDLLTIFNTGDDNVRQAAAETLGVLKSGIAISELSDALQNSHIHYNVRQAAARSLGKIGDAKAIPVLKEALDDKKGIVRHVVAEALYTLGWQPENTAEKVQYAVASQNWAALQYVEQENLVLPVAVRLASDHDNNLTEFIAWFNVATPGVQSELIELLRGNENSQRVIAARILAASGWQPDQFQDKILIYALRDEWQEIATLGSAALPELRKIIPVIESASRIRVIETLANIADPESMRDLKAFLEDSDPELREASAKALGRFKMQEQEVGDILIKALHDNNTSVRIAAVRSLGSIQDRRVTTLVSIGLIYSTDNDESLRHAAAEVLKSLGSNVIGELDQQGGKALEAMRPRLEQVFRRLFGSNDASPKE